MTKVSSSEELSSDAPRMNLRGCLFLGSALALGTVTSGGVWQVSGDAAGCSGITSEAACDG